MAAAMFTVILLIIVAVALMAAVLVGIPVLIVMSETSEQRHFDESSCPPIPPDA